MEEGAPQETYHKDVTQQVDEDMTDTNNNRRGEKRKCDASTRAIQHLARKKEEECDYEPDLDYLDDSTVVLDWYDSDLNLVIDRVNLTTGTPMHEGGFALLWAGARATYGFTSGKIYYEVRLLEHLDISHLTNEPLPYQVRIGFSTDNVSTSELGQDRLSYGYDSTGKAYSNGYIADYGTTFQAGDIIGVYLDLTSELISLSFAVNGQIQELGHAIPKAELEGKALFPHVMTKNVKFQVNFGQEDSCVQLLPEFLFVGHVPLNQRVPGPTRPKDTKDCEVIMMCGLPGSGKTAWVNEVVAKQPEKKYNILGTNHLIDKIGLQRTNSATAGNYSDDWEAFIDTSTECFNKLLRVAANRRRNYIIDQTNVYPNAQRLKMSHFENFKRRAVVLVPSDTDDQVVPKTQVLKMKANFKLPEVGDVFHEVFYAALPEYQARQLVEQYNKEGTEAGYGQRPRFKGNSKTTSKRPFGNLRGAKQNGTDRNRGGQRDQYGNAAPMDTRN